MELINPQQETQIPDFVQNNPLVQALLSQSLMAYLALERTLDFKGNIDSGLQLSNHRGHEFFLMEMTHKIVVFYLEISKNPRTLAQSQVLAVDVFDQFKGESLEDIALFFRMLRRGEFSADHGDAILAHQREFLEKKAAVREYLYYSGRSNIPAPRRYTPPPLG